MPVGEAMREARMALDLTQATFGEKFGLTRRQVVEIENGSANPTAATLNRIARPFGMTVGFVHADPERRGSGASEQDQQTEGHGPDPQRVGKGGGELRG